MLHSFPAFSYEWNGGRATWRGPLQPRPGGAIYRIRIMAHGAMRPKVIVCSLPLDPRPPHLYPDDTLCLYDPRNRGWHVGRPIAGTIVPWTAEWLLFFEIWQETGTWWGPEAPHATGAPKR